MYQKIKAKFKANPTIFYACSIVASWAGVGSLMNFRTLAINNGAAAAIIWAVFNSLACILFGLFAEYIPTVRRLMQSKVMFYFIGFLTVFQTWTQMSGIYEIFGDTPIGTTGGTLIVYGTCIVFLLLLLKDGMIRNVLSDGFSWVVVYGLLAVVVVAALVYTRGNFVNIDPGLNAAGIQTGLYKGFLLLPGPFTYPYYYSLFSYNDKNSDGTRRGNMKMSFVLAGVMFGVYMVLAALLTWVNFSPLLNTMKAILITIIALSSLSTYLYSEYLVFGDTMGFILDVITVCSWQIVIPLGVMGIWTLMSEIRLYIKERNLEFPEIYMRLYEAGVRKNALRLCAFFGDCGTQGLRWIAETDNDLWERIQRREPNAYLVLLYWDSEMFRRTTRKRGELEEESEKKDYKALCKDLLFLHPEKYTIAKDTKSHLDHWRGLFIKTYGIAEQKHYKTMYEGLLYGDPKMRILRILWTTIYNDHNARIKEEQNHGKH